MRIAGIRFDSLGQSKIGNEGMSLLIDENVRRLQITMQNATTMSISDRSTDRSEHLRRGTRRLRPIQQFPSERRSFNQLHTEEGAAIDLTDFVDGDDMSMMQLGGGFRFRTEPSQVRRRGQITSKDHLECDDPVQLLLPGLIDHPHAAATKLFQQFVVAVVASFEQAGIGAVLWRRFRKIIQQSLEAGEVFGDLDGRPQFAKFPFQMRMIGHNFVESSRGAVS
jgi:hypothetical protein